ncbi:MAG: hypothetical protein OXF04_00790 [bacterium]|nr:hypothetical protein [bacterium]
MECGYSFKIFLISAAEGKVVGDVRVEGRVEIDEVYEFVGKLLIIVKDLEAVASVYLTIALCMRERERERERSVIFGRLPLVGIGR